MSEVVVMMEPIVLGIRQSVLMNVDQEHHRPVRNYVSCLHVEMA